MIANIEPDSNVFLYDAESIGNYSHYSKNGIYISCIMKLNKVLFKRNKYLIDIGDVVYNNRISIFVDRENKLCLRIIDNNCLAELIHIKSNAIFNNYFEIEYQIINENEPHVVIYINKHLIKDAKLLPPFLLNIRKFNTSIGSNLLGEYCGAMYMKKLFITLAIDGYNIPIGRWDFSKKENISVSQNGHIGKVKSD